jgi:hypothetical protein
MGCVSAPRLVPLWNRGDLWSVVRSCRTKLQRNDAAHPSRAYALGCDPRAVSTSDVTQRGRAVLARARAADEGNQWVEIRWAARTRVLNSVSSFIAKKEECDRLAAGAPDTQRTQISWRRSGNPFPMNLIGEHLWSAPFFIEDRHRGFGQFQTQQHKPDPLPHSYPPIVRNDGPHNGSEDLKSLTN